MTTEPNFDEMSMDDLKSYIEDNQPGQSENEKVEDEKEVTEDTEVDEQGNVDGQVDEPANQKQNPFQGKSAEELLKIIQDQQKYISQRGNEIGEFKRELNELRAAMAAKDSTKQENKEDDDFSDWDKDQIEVVEKLVEKKLTAREKEKVELQNREREDARKSNLEAYQRVKDDKDLFSLIGSELDRLYEKYGEDAIYTKGWVENAVGKAVRDIITKKTKEDEVEDKLKRKKEQAQTTKTTSTTAETTVSKKPVSKMSADEYLEYAKANLGLVDSRRRK